MKLVLYGISRSGKDYFVDKLISVLKSRNIELFHVKGSQTLNEISKKIYLNEFKNLCNEDKDVIRRQFIKELEQIEKKHKNIIVDGHYAFYDENFSLKKVFTEDDLTFYDRFIYLDTDSEIILQRMRNSIGDKKNNYISIEQLNYWKNYEIENLSDELINIDKELHVINIINKFTYDYFYDLLNGKYESKMIAENMLNGIDFSGYNSVVLLDCDKTLSNEDSTSIIMKNKGIESLEIKKIYINDRYSNYQAYLAGNYYKENNIFSNDSFEIVKKIITPNSKLIDDLKSLSNVKLIAVTAGNSKLWKEILNSFELNIEVLDHDDFVVSKYVKYYVSKLIRKKNKYVIAIGDSLIDSLMLKYSNKGYIIGNKGIRDNVYTFLIENKNVRQLSYNSVLYDCIDIEKSINSIKTIGYDEKTFEDITICKSDSNIEGKLLRLAHYRLGYKVSELIKNEYLYCNFTVVILMRSGLCFGQGIVDNLDCCELFYYDENPQKFYNELNENKKYRNTTIVLVDGVVNSGKTIQQLINNLQNYNVIIATNVLSDKYNANNCIPMYTSRVSKKSFVGAKQKNYENGKGPDTSDRLFRNM